MKKIMTLVIVVSLLFSSGVLFAQAREGVQLEITKTDGKVIYGELIGVKQDSTLILESSLLESSSGIGGSIDVSEVKTIKIVKGSKTRTGVIVGILAGGAIGVAIGYTIGYQLGPTAESGAIKGGLVGGLVGGSLGAGIGSSIHNYETFQIEGKSQEEIKAFLEKLRTQARFPNYQ